MRRPSGPVAGELSRRDFVGRVGALGAGALVLGALPVAERMIRAEPALAAVSYDDATLQAFADTMIPGRRAERTDLGDEIHPDAIAGVDDEPGAVEADALRVYHDPLIGFSALAAPFLADLSLRSLQQGGPFLSLPFDGRVAVCLQALDFSNGDRVLYEAAAAVPFTAFCAATEQPNPTSRTASGYRVMGHPGAAPNGYRSFSYRRRLSRERTKRGYLP
ncbi:MAG TPA: DUF5987 family protein [Thermoleophilaceae bacterium]|jgi:hypothetical protein